MIPRAGGSLTTTECGHLRPQTPVKDSGSLMTTKRGHLRPQNLIFTDRANKTSTVHGVTCDHRMRSLTTTKHFHNRTTEGGGVGGGGVGGMITYLGLHTDTPKGGLVYRFGLAHMLAHFGGWGWGGWDDNVPWLAHRHAERWSGLPALGLQTCWPILVGGGGVGGMITYLGLHTDTPKGGLVTGFGLARMLAHFGGWGWGGWDDNVPQSTTPVLLCTTKYYSVLQSTTRKYYSSTTFYYKVQLQYYSVLLQYHSSPNIVLRLSTQISANAAPANKSDTPTSPNNALATRSETPT